MAHCTTIVCCRSCPCHFLPAHCVAFPVSGMSWRGCTDVDAAVSMVLASYQNGCRLSSGVPLVWDVYHHCATRFWSRAICSMRFLRPCFKVGTAMLSGPLAGAWQQPDAQHN
jgi:hypothetical protein